MLVIGKGKLSLSRAKWSIPLEHIGFYQKKMKRLGVFLLSPGWYSSPLDGTRPPAKWLVLIYTPGKRASGL